MIRRIKTWRWFEAVEIALSLVFVLAAAAAADLLLRQNAIVNPAPVFLIAVLLAASLFGVRAAIVSALSAFFLFNFFLVEPRYAFRLASPDDYLGLLLFLAVALITGYFAGQAHDQARRSQDRAQILGALFEAGSTMAASASPEEIARAAARAGVRLAGVGVCVMARPPGGPWSGDTPLALLARDGAEAAAPPLAARDLDHLTSALAQGWSGWRLEGAEGPLGALLVARPARAGDPETARMLGVLAQLTATALERAALQGEVSQARLQAESDRLRAALLNSVSHDFRTPLSGILAAATSLVQDGESFDPATRRDLAQTIQADAERLGRYTRNLLDMTRLEGGAVRARLDWIDVAEALGAVASQARRLHPGVEIVVTPPAQPWLVRADDMLLEQALLNYVENAAEWAGDGGRLQLSAAPVDGGLGLMVDDDGPGVGPDDIDHVFEKHYRGGDPAARRLGPGLGLSIVRGFAEAMGARAIAESPSPVSGGARFSLVFPETAVEQTP